jgi:hypothetical protein
MTEEQIIKLALDAHLLNYVDNETPRRYFICGNADLEEVLNFARSVINTNRDELAEKAMQGVLASSITFRSEHEVAALAYKVADAMLEAREKEKSV